MADHFLDNSASAQRNRMLDALRCGPITTIEARKNLDIMMPGMDGFAFLEEFDKLQTEVKGKSKIIMLSTSESFRDLNRANKNPFVRKFLNKPLTQQVLQAINV